MVNFLTKEKILAAAINQYSLHNYHGATMQKIAKEVGIKPASIYFFYKNKEDLFVAAFEQLLEDHFTTIQKIMNGVRGRPLLDVFQHLFNGAVEYHIHHENETNAYISLINSPPQEIKHFLHEHMARFDDWLFESLLDITQIDQPHITEEQAVVLTKQAVLLMDGLFWEINLYDKNTLRDQIKLALDIMKILLEGLKHEK